MAVTSAVRHLAFSAALLTLASPLFAQHNSSQAAVGMTATVLPNLKLQPQVFAFEDEAVTASVIPEGADGFRVQARTTGRGKVILRIPVRLSANVKSFTLSASSTDARGTVRIVGAQSENISLLSSQKPLESSSTFALGLPGPGRRSAAGTLNGTIEIALAELSQGETKAFSIRLNISQNGAGQ